MDEQRFDRMAKSIAAWTSRRRFVASVAGLAAGGIVASRSAVAQSATATPCATVAPPAPADQGVLEKIVTSANKLNGFVTEFKSLVDQYNSVNPDTPLFIDPLQDQLVMGFVDDLLWITDDATHAIDCGQHWTQVHVNSYINTLDVIVNSISVGVDLGAYNGLMRAKLRVLATPSADSVDQGDCSTPPQRSELCTATCLDVWEKRQSRFLSPADTEKLIEAFNSFIECLLYFGSATVESVCLAELINDGCLLREGCSCSGDCH